MENLLICIYFVVYCHSCDPLDVTCYHPVNLTFNFESSCSR